MSNGITFAGQPLLLEDPAGAIQAWLDNYLPTSDLRIVTSPVRSSWNSFNVPTPNYSDPLQIKLNTWYRPIGASRWAFGLFLCDTATKDRIITAIGSTNAGQSLRFTSDVLDARSWLAYLLPPHPISDSLSRNDGAWLLPIVDERYYWQFIDAGGFTLTDSSTWSSLFSSLATALGITLNVDSISADYGTPNAVAFNKGNRANAAQVLDAAAHSVGQRIVLQYQANGPNQYPALVYQSCNWTSSISRRNDNFAARANGFLQDGSATTGLNLASLAPQYLEVMFPKWANGIVYENEYYSKTLNASNYVGANGYTAGFHRTIQTTALADYTTGGGSPDNQTTVDAMAAQIASDFYAQQGWVQDSIYFDVNRWIETGFDDYVEFQVGRRRADGTYTTQVRVHTAPYNFGVGTMLHQVANTHEYDDVVEGKLDSNLTPDSTAVLSVWEGSPRADSGRNVTVTDRMHQWIASGSWVIARRIEKEWRVLRTDRDVIGYTNAAHNKGSTGTIKIYTGATAGAETDTGTTLSAYNGFCDLKINKRVVCRPIENGWHIVTGDGS